jgi:acetyl esterase/lipase
MCDFSEYGIPTEEWLKVEAELPEPTPHQPEPSLEELKQVTNMGREAVAWKEMQALSDKVNIQDHSIPARDGYSLEARSYRRRQSQLPSTDGDSLLPIYIHFHGGGFLFGTLSSEDAICSRLAINTQPDVIVVNVNYRHTPEHPYPTAWNDAEDALRWVHENASDIGGDGGKIIVGGISAGAWLSAALTQTATNNDNFRASSGSKIRILGQVLMIPCLVYEDCYESQLAQLKDPGLSSYIQNEHAPILPLSRIKLFNSLLKVKHPADPSDRRLNPGNATPEEVRGLPPTTLGVAGRDPLRDEALLHGKLLAENG